MLEQYLAAGFRVFPLWPVDRGGNCTCGDATCKQPGKHPRLSRWQQVPHWSDEQIDAMREYQALDQHFGVVIDPGTLVVDIDPRNGGDEAYWQLVEQLDGEDLAMRAGLVVNTGGGGRHLYFRVPEAAYVQHLSGLSGIDFKTSGYIVGAGSLHASGTHYEGHGDPADLNDAPQPLVDMLRRPDVHRASYRGASVDVSSEQLREMLSCIPADCDHETWIRCGMAIHHATQGAAFDLWDEWSARGDKYPGKEALDRRWHSFGKAANPVTIATLVYNAQQHGYQLPVTIEGEPAESTLETPCDTSNIDILRPPGLVGDVADWINNRCRYPRERLAVMAALNTVGNVAGLRYTDDKDRANLNLLTLCVAASSTGKEAVYQCATELHAAVGVQGAVVGNIKSEQEIVRNLTRHQASYYLVDEIGYLLQKIESARKKGGAAYLDGIISTIMAAYSKADGSFLVSGDLKESVRQELQKELAQCDAKVSENEDPSGFYEHRAQDIRERGLPEIELGIQRPFLSMLGMTTPISFDSLITIEQATNGFIGRCILLRESETNPRRKRGFRHPGYAVPDSIRIPLCQLHDGGNFDARASLYRIEHHGDKVPVATEDAAVEMLEDIADWLEDYAETQKGATGLEAVVRRSYEHITKVSTILALGEGVRTTEHVRWAYALCMEDMRNKLAVAQANIEEGTDNALRVRVLEAAGEGEKHGTIRNRVSRARAYTADDAERMLAWLIERGEVVEEERQHARTGKPYAVYRRADMG